MFYQNHVFSFHCNILIQGHFGQVYKGTYQGKDVAVKLYTGRISAEQSKKFVQEGMILKEYNHPNIVRFIGIAAQKHPIMIVTEYVSSKNKSFNTYFFFIKLMYEDEIRNFLISLNLSQRGFACGTKMQNIRAYIYI